VIFSFHPVVLDDLLNETTVIGEAVSERSNEAFKAFRVVDRNNGLLVVSHQVGLELNTTRLLFGNDHIAHLEEVSLHFAVMVIEFLSTLNASRTLVGLEDDQELMKQLTSLSHEVLLVQVDDEAGIVLSEFNSDNISLLVLKQVLSQDISSLSVSLSPFLVLSIE